MADKKISQLLVATTPLTGTEIVPIVQGANTRQTSVANFGAAVSYTPAGTGAVVTTVQAKLRESVSVKDFGTNTAAVQAAIDSLGAGGGFVLVNRGVTYTFSSLTVPQNVTLFDEANNRLVFHDCALEDGSATNLLLRSPIDGATRVHVEPRGYPSGTAAKTDWMFDPYQSDSANYRVVNIYTKTYASGDASTTQGNNGVAVLGVKGEGNNFGIWPTLHFGFSDDGASAAVPMKMYYFDTSDTVWRTPMKGAWRTGIAITANDYILASNNLYQATTTGTTGNNVPIHTSGSASDGGVTWNFIRNFAAAASSIKGCVLFGDRDELPKFGLPTVRAQFSQDAAIWNGKKIRFLDNTSTSAWSVYTSVGSDDLYIETEDGAKRLRLDATGQFIQITGLSIASNSITAANLDTTPSILGVRTLVFNNSGATSVTQFISGIAYQEFYVRSANSQTTLVHGTNIRLIGGVNKLLGVDDVLLFQMNGSGTVATQVI